MLEITLTRIKLMSRINSYPLYHDIYYYGINLSKDQVIEK